MFRRFATAAFCTAIAAHAGVFTGTLYYTTFSGTPNVHKVDYSYDGVTIVYTGKSDVASTSGADGILFAPDGNLLIAGQNNDHVTEITPTGTFVGQASTGTGSFHLALNSNQANATLFNMWNGPGSGSAALTSIVLASGGILGASTPTTYTIVGGSSHDIRGVIFDPVNGKWYYGTAPDGGSGDFGEISFSGSTATLSLIASGKFSHGLTYDPFSQSIIFSSENHITQFDPTSNLFYDLFNANGNFDQSAVDGLGHLFVASNSSDIVFVDYSATGKINTVGNFTNAQFLANSLDDIAPLSGTGSNNPGTPEPASLALVGSALLFAIGRRKFAR